MLTDKQIDEYIDEARHAIEEIEKLPEAERIKATCEFLELDLTREADRAYWINYNCFLETSNRKFMDFEEKTKECY